MALHDRLKNPTLEVPPSRAGFGMPVAMALVLLAAGFAYAMPRAMNTSADGEQVAPLVSPTPSITPTATVSPTPEPTESDDGDDGGAKDNHGEVVSTAAHCPVKGKAHGELVRSIAKDKDATVADAEAACAAALAAEAAAVPKEHGKPDHAAASKPVKAPKEEKTHPAPPATGKKPKP
jgi:hypothetical protein